MLIGIWRLLAATAAQEVSLMDPARQLLFDFEREVDHYIESADVWQLPLRSVLSALFLTVDGLIARGDAERAGSLVSQLSLLCPLLSRCGLEICASAEDALSIVGEQEVQTLRQAILYGRFCELMPDVRHNHYRILSEDTGFSLTYDAENQCAEEYDFALHEISKATNSCSLVD